MSLTWVVCDSVVIDSVQIHVGCLDVSHRRITTDVL